ncbi:hypothetical protein [Kordiimonas pumila]|uniref:Antifreeze glycopeptide n=2 Tax=Kordiimonas pumila TaxID=2161677 RepID=A0ABV7D1X6_9PROT
MFLKSALFAATFAIAPFSAGFAQDEDAGTSAEQPVEAGQDAKPETAIEPAVKDKNTRSFYYLGGKPVPARQQGPTLPPPVSILPQPYVPKGSVTVPPAPDTRIPGAAEITTGTMPDGTASVPDENTVPDDADMQETEGDQGVGAEDQFLEVSALEQLDPSAMGVLPRGEGYARDFWAGLQRAQIIERYKIFSKYAASPALKAIANRAALSGFILPAPESDTDIISMLDSRLSLLENTGNSEGYRALLAKLPAGRDWSGLARHFSNAYLLDGRLGDACALAATQRAVDANPYWVRIAAFCKAANADRQGVDFELQILSEVIDIQPAFYKLIDQILIEAEQGGSTVLASGSAITYPMKVELLETAMARLARATIEMINPEGANPLAYKALLALPGLSGSAKIALLDLGLKQGLVSGAEIAAFAQSAKASEIADAHTLSDADAMGFDVDAALLQQAATADDQSQAALIRDFWAASQAGHYSVAVASGLVKLADTKAVTALSPFVAEIVFRAALVSEDYKAAQSWFTALRGSSAGADSSVDAQLLSSAPLAAIAGLDGAPSVTPDSLLAWWHGAEKAPTAYAKANLLFSVLDALGETVPDDAWEQLDNGPVAAEAKAVNPAQWRGYIKAVQSGNKSLALVYAFRLASGGTAAIPATLAGSLIGNLKDLGFEREARQLAVEMLVAQGL